MADLPLGRQVEAPQRYWPDALVAIPRDQGRSSLKLREIPFSGWDRWTAWEFAWCDTEGCRHAGVLDICVPADSPAIFESKSLKLYLNSCFYATFASQDELMAEIEGRLEQACGAAVELNCLELSRVAQAGLMSELPGDCLDLVVPSKDPRALRIQYRQRGFKQLYWTHGFRSLCPVTGQPDWATLFVELQGVSVDTADLTAYLYGYADHQGFHESCVEQIFVELWQHWAPEALAVTARYTRRGGIDINPYRTSDPGLQERNLRLARQ